LLSRRYWNFGICFLLYDPPPLAPCHHFGRRQQPMRQPVEPSLQLNLSLLTTTASAIPDNKQKELMLALVELLSSAAAESVQPQANGGDDESETHA
jgi:hypothetical protein